jgi:nicotinate-nucleotide adenylyltransferase
MKIGILGGTFDPIHLAHLLIAEIARETLNLERVLFTPAGDPPHKQARSKTGAHHRRAMVELAVVGNPCFELCPVDLDRPGPHYSVDTVRLIRAQYELSADQCFFIIGGDSLKDLPDWHEPQELVELCHLAVAQRPGYRPDLSDLETVVPGLTNRLAWVETPVMEIASSEIRDRVSQGHSIRYQVPEPIRAYIDRYGLYRQEG